jgi:hypothetical protein
MEGAGVTESGEPVGVKIIDSDRGGGPPTPGDQLEDELRRKKKP